MTPCPVASSHVHCPPPHWVRSSPFPARTRPSQHSQAPPGQLEVIALPNGFQPEGIAIGPGGTGYVGSLADGDVYVFDVRTGEEITTLEGPGSPSVGLKVDNRDRLFIAGGPTGSARVVDAATGELLESYQSSTAGADVRERRRRDA